MTINSSDHDAAKRPSADSDLVCCLECNYEVTGLFEEGVANCPECGAELSRWRIQCDHWRRQNAGELWARAWKLLLRGTLTALLVATVSWLAGAIVRVAVAIAVVLVGWIAVTALAAMIVGLWSPRHERSALRAVYLAQAHLIHAVWLIGVPALVFMRWCKERPGESTARVWIASGLLVIAIGVWVLAVYRLAGSWRRHWERARARGHLYNRSMMPSGEEIGRALGFVSLLIVMVTAGFILLT